jgi:hypothetical protein
MSLFFEQSQILPKKPWGWWFSHTLRPQGYPQVWWMKIGGCMQVLGDVWAANERIGR